MYRGSCGRLGQYKRNNWGRFSTLLIAFCCADMLPRSLGCSYTTKSIRLGIYNAICDFCVLLEHSVHSASWRRVVFCRQRLTWTWSGRVTCALWRGAATLCHGPQLSTSRDKSESAFQLRSCGEGRSGKFVSVIDNKNV